MLPILLALAQAPTLHGTVDFGGAPFPSGRVEVVLSTLTCREGEDLLTRPLPPLVERSRAPVAIDGSFRIERPANADWIELSVDGTFATQHAFDWADSVSFEPGGPEDPGDGPVAMNAIVGGVAELRLAPVGPVTAEEFAALRGADELLQGQQPGVSDGGGVTAVVTFDAYGRARLEGLQPYAWEFDRQFRSAWTHGPDFVPKKPLESFVIPSATWFHVRPGEVASFAVPLLRQRPYAGRVVESDGRPAQHAEVAVRADWPYWDRWDVSATRTDAEGRFSLPAGPPWLHSIEVVVGKRHRIELGPLEWAALQGGDEEVTVVLPPEPPSFEVRAVFPDGRPAVGLPLSGTAPDGNRGYGTTDADGIARLTGLEPGRAIVSGAGNVKESGELEARGYSQPVRTRLRRDQSPSPRWFVEADVAGADASGDPPEVTLRRCSDVAVEVGVPEDVAPASVRLLVFDARMGERNILGGSGPLRSDSLPRQPGPTDDGALRFRGPLAPGKYCAVAYVWERQERSPDLRASPTITFDVPGGVSEDPSAAVRLDLPATTAVHGRVLYDDGTAAVGARLVVSNWLRGRRDVLTDAEGRFRIGDVGEGPATLSVHAVDAFDERRDVEIGRGSEPLEFVVRRGARIKSSHVGRTSVLVAPRNLDGESEMPSGLALHHETGLSQRLLAPASVDLVRFASTPGSVHVRARGTVELVAGETTAAELAPEARYRRAVRLIGKVELGWLGAARVGVLVQTADGPVAATWTEGAGTFVCDVPEADTYTISVHEICDGIDAGFDIGPRLVELLFAVDEARVIARRTVSGGDEAEIHVPPIALADGAIWGTLMFPESRAPRRASEVVARGADGRIVRRAVVHAGRFRLGWLEPGEFDIEVEGRDDESARTRVRVTPGGPTYVGLGPASIRGTRRK